MGLGRGVSVGVGVALGRGVALAVAVGVSVGVKGARLQAASAKTQRLKKEARTQRINSDYMRTVLAQCG